MFKIAVSILTIGLVACASPPEDTPVLAHQMQAVISAGEVDNASTGVVGIAIQGGRGVGSCTGTLIAPNLVLTAQHCVAATPNDFVVCGRSTFGDPYSADSFGVTTEVSIWNARSWYGVSRVEVPAPNADLCGNDIAVLVLDRNVPGATATPFNPRLNDYPRSGDRVTVIGYGTDESGRRSGTRKSLNNREITCAGASCRRFGATANEIMIDGGTCQGDSGGPILDAELFVLGALSRGGQGCSYPTYSSTAGWSDWLRQMAVNAAADGRYEVPAWVDGEVGPPPPDTDEDGVRDPYDNCPEDRNAACSRLLNCAMRTQLAMHGGAIRSVDPTPCDMVDGGNRVHVGLTGDATGGKKLTQVARVMRRDAGRPGAVKIPEQAVLHG